MITTGRRPPPASVAAAAVVAAVVSGLPSTAAAWWTNRTRPPRQQAGALLASTRAAGTLLGRPTIAGGAAAHVAVSAWWSLVLSRVLPPGRGAAAGALAGLGIAALDLGIVGRRFPAVATLPTGPQVADHVVFGLAFGATLDRLGGRWDRPGVR